ncbi:hypothetical protein [Synechococcus phage Yong-M3-232]|nr:hypothetical protein [Synechococcus phage Yong-M3-232]
MIDPKQERTALWMLFGLLALSIVGACAVVVLTGLALAQIAKWVFGA